MKYYGKIQDIKDLTTKEYVDKKLNIEQADETFVLKQENVDVTENVALALNEYIKSASIIDCDELPTEEIADNTIYRVRTVKEILLPGTPVPTIKEEDDPESGQVYINNSISKDKFNKLAELMNSVSTWWEEDIKCYRVAGPELVGPNLICIVDDSSGSCEIDCIYNYLDYNYDNPYYTSESWANDFDIDFIGWNPDVDFSQPINVDYCWYENPGYGCINNKLIELFSGTAFEMSEEISYDYYIYKNEWQRLSTGLDVKEKTYDKLIKISIPNSGMGKEIHFDITMSNEEVKSLLESIHNDEEFIEICYSETTGTDLWIDYDNDYPLIKLNWDPSTESLILYNYDNGGWITDFNGIITNFVDLELSDNYEGDPVGIHNEELVDLCWYVGKDSSTSFIVRDSEGNEYKLALGEDIPAQKGQSGKVLMTNGVTPFWSSMITYEEVE